MSDLMRFAAVAALVALAACARTTPTSGDAICDGTLAMRKELAGALAGRTGGDEAIIAGQRLLAALKASCQGGAT